jgi:hypothetical protein
VGRPFGGLYEGSAFIENQVCPYGSREWIGDIWILVGGAMTLSAPPGLTIIWWQNRHRRAIPKGPPELAGCCRRPDSQSGCCHARLTAAPADARCGRIFQVVPFHSSDSGLRA